MKNMLTPSCNLAVSLLLGFWGCASAQSLGTPSGEILLGRPLEITLPARFPNVDTGDECVHADVFFGDSRLKAGQVRSSVTGPEGQRRIRIETDSPVDEPVVTVSVRAGCRNTITRNYTLLPEYPSETLLAAAAARSAVANPVAAAPVPLQLATSTAPAQRPSVVRAARAPAVAQAVADAAPPVRSARSTRAARQDTVVARGPRLKLEPLELLEPEAQTLLRVSHNLSNPNGDAARRATAALMWKAINADPQELLRTTAMLQKLESDLAQLRQTSAQTRAEMLALRRRLEQSQPWYASAPLVQGLLLLVLAAATAAGVLWWRTRRLAAGGEPWYAQGSEPSPAPAITEAQELAEVPAPQPAAVERREAQPLPVAAAPAAPIHPAVAEPSGGIDFELPPGTAAAAARGTDGVLRVEALAATFEEVEFLSSLGLGADAMDVLKAYLQDSISPAPIAFFELMRLCDEADDPAAVATVRRRYAQVFGLDAPRLEQFTRPLGLDGNAELSARITRAWGSGEAPALIEDALFKVPAPGAPLTLQAGRDLLSLYDLAMARATEASTPAAGHEADAHPLAPWAAAEDQGAAQMMAQAIAEAQGGHHFALDVDLTAAPEPLPDRQETELAPLLAELKAAAEREQAQRAQEEHVDAFSAAVASERIPLSRY